MKPHDFPHTDPGPRRSAEPRIFEWRHLPRWLWALPVFWTLLIALALWWNTDHINLTVQDLARRAALTSFEKDLLYRQWAALHGGVYVPVTDRTPPNPYLVDLPERDIATASGRRLTLMNPAYMTRQVHELGQQLYRHSGHITSLKPIRPENAPDAWERKALEAFDRGIAEVSSIESREGERYLRFMRPLRTDASCLKCHAIQGYREGDIRGGISVDVPISEYKAIVQPHQREELLAHGIIWILGLGLLAVGGAQIRLRERAQTALKESEARFRAMFEDFPVAIWEEDFSQLKAGLDELHQSKGTGLKAFLDSNPDEVAQLVARARVIAINQTSVRLFGAERKKQIVCNQSRFLTAEFLEKFKEIVIGLAEGRRHFSGEAHLLNAHGLPVVFDATLSVQPGYENDWSQVLVSFADVTERNRAEEKLRERNRLIEAIIENAPIGFAVNTIQDGKSVFVGSKFEEIYGVPRGSLHGVDDFFEKVYGDPVFREQMRARIVADVVSGDPARMRWENIPITTAAGDKRYVSAQNIPVFDQDLMVSTVQDVSERHLTAEALRASVALYHDLVETSQDLIWQCDAEGHYTYLNPAWEETLGYRVEEMLGKSFADFQLPEHARLDSKIFLHLLSGKSIKGHETAHLRKDGQVVHLVFNAKRILDNLGQSAGTRGTAYDITERKRAEEQVRYQMEELQRWRDVTLGREDRIQELKREVNELLGRLREPVRYESQMEHS